MFDASSQIYEFIFPGIFLVSINTQLISKIELNSLGDIENAKKVSILIRLKCAPSFILPQM